MRTLLGRVLGGAVAVVVVIAAGCGSGEEGSPPSVTEAPSSTSTTTEQPTTTTLSPEAWSAQAQPAVEELVDAMGEYARVGEDYAENGGSGDTWVQLACDVMLDRVNTYDDLIRAAPIDADDAAAAMDALRAHAEECPLPGVDDLDQSIADHLTRLYEISTRAGLDLSEG